MKKIIFVKGSGTWLLPMTKATPVIKVKGIPGKNNRRNRTDIRPFDSFKYANGLPLAVSSKTIQEYYCADTF